MECEALGTGVPNVQLPSYVLYTTIPTGRRGIQSIKCTYLLVRIALGRWRILVAYCEA